MDKLKDLIADTKYSVDNGVTTCTLILKDGKGSIVGQVTDTSKTAQQAAYDQAAASAVAWLGLDVAAAPTDATKK